MAYLTIEQVKSQYASTLGEQVSRGIVTESMITEWINKASNLIDGKVAQRYKLPFVSVPPLIITLAWEFFEYFWQKAVHTPPAEGTEVNWLFPRYDRALAILEEISSGKIPLFDSEGNLIQPSETRLGTIDSNHLRVDQVFSMKDSWEQEVDSEYSTEPEA